MAGVADVGSPLSVVNDDGYTPPDPRKTHAKWAGPKGQAFMCVITGVLKSRMQGPLVQSNHSAEDAALFDGFRFVSTIIDHSMNAGSEKK